MQGLRLKHSSLTLSAIILLSSFCYQNISATPVFISSFNTQDNGTGGLLAPQSVDVNTTNDQFIVSTSNNRVQLYNNVGTFVSQFGSAGTGTGQFQSPEGVAFNSNNNQILVVDSGNNRVEQFDASGSFLSQFGSMGSGAGQFQAPRHLAISSTNQIVVTDSNNARVQIFDSVGIFQSQFGTAGAGAGQFNNPFGVTAPVGQIVVSDNGNNRVQIFDGAGVFQSQFGSAGSGDGQFNSPVGLRSIGQIFVVDQNNNRFEVFSNLGVFQSQFGSFGTGSGQFNAPLAIRPNNANGQIAVADTGNSRVQILFDPAIWAVAGTSTLSVLPLNQAMNLNAGFNLNVLGQTTLNSAASITLNGGSLVSGSVLMDGGTLTAAQNTTLTSPFSLSSNGGFFSSNVGINLSLTGAISSNFVGAGTALIKLGAGVLTLSGANTYTNPTDIQVGTLRMGATNVMPSSGSLSVTGTFDLNGFSQVVGDLSGSGPTTLGAGTLTFGTATSSVTYNGVISGSGGVIKAGSGTAIFGGANNYTGGTTVNAGTLQGTTATLPGNFSLQDSSNLLFAQLITGTYAGNISGPGMVTKQNVGTLIWTGANTHTGGTVVSVGALQAGATNTFSPSGLMTVNLPGSLNLNNFSQTIGDLTGNGNITLGTANLTFGSNTTTVYTYSGNLTSTTGRIVKNGTSTAIITGSNNYNGGTVNQGTLQGNTGSIRGNFTLNDAAILVFDQTFAGNYTGVISSTGSVVIQNTGTVVFSGANTYSGGTTVAGGTLQAGATNTLPVGRNITITGATATLNLVNFSQTIGDLSGVGFISIGTTPAPILVLGTSTPSTTYSGRISGSGRLGKQGSGVLILLGTNTYSGGTIINAGTLQGNSNSLQGNFQNNAGIIVFDQFFTGTYAGNIGGGGSFVKQNDGNLTLTGNHTFTGGTNINGGILTVNGSLAGPVQVNAGGTLKGTGTLGGTVTNNGTVSPGTSIGTLTINGNYNPGATGTTNIEINSLGQSSSLVVNGTTNLNGALSVTANPGQYTSGMQFGIIRTPTITGSFSSLPASVGPFVPSVFYDSPSQTLFLVLTRGLVSTHLVGANANQQAIANYFDSLPTPPIGSALGNLIGTLATLSPGDLGNALESINPGKTSVATLVAEDQMALLNYMNTTRLAHLRRIAREGLPENQFLGSSFMGSTKQAFWGAEHRLNQRPKLFETKTFNTTKHGLNAHPSHRVCLLPSSNQRTAIWGQGFGYFANQHPHKIDPGFDAKTGGLILGIDHDASKNFIVGAGVGRFRTRINLDQDAGNIRANTNFLTAYGTWYRNRFYIDASIVGGWAEYDTRQHIVFPTIDVTLRGGYHAAQIAPHLGAGYEFCLNEFRVTPFIGADYIYVREQAHALSNATVLDMQLNQKLAMALYGELGIKVARTYECIHARFTPEAVLSYTNKMFGKGRVVAGLIGQTAPFFTVLNFSSTRYQITPGVSVTVDFINGGFLTAHASTQFGAGYRGYDVGLKFGVPF